MANEERKHFWHYILNEQGDPIQDAEIRLYLNDNPTVEAKIFLGPSTATSTTSSVADLKTDENGFVEFWIGEAWETDGYPHTQKFRLEWYKAGTAPGLITNLDPWVNAFQWQDLNTGVDRNDINKFISDFYGQKWNDHVSASVPSASPHTLAAVNFTAGCDAGRDRYNKVVSDQWIDDIITTSDSVSAVGYILGECFEKQQTIATGSWSSSGSVYYFDITHDPPISTRYNTVEMLDTDTLRQVIPKRVIALSLTTTRVVIDNPFNAVVNVQGYTQSSSSSSTSSSSSSSSESVFPGFTNYIRRVPKPQAFSQYPDPPVVSGGTMYWTTRSTPSSLYTWDFVAGSYVEEDTYPVTIPAQDRGRGPAILNNELYIGSNARGMLKWNGSNLVQIVTPSSGNINYFFLLNGELFYNWNTGGSNYQMDKWNGGAGWTNILASGVSSNFNAHVVSGGKAYLVSSSNELLYEFDGTSLSTYGPSVSTSTRRNMYIINNRICFAGRYPTASSPTGSGYGLYQFNFNSNVWETVFNVGGTDRLYAVAYYVPEDAYYWFQGPSGSEKNMYKYDTGGGVQNLGVTITDSGSSSIERAFQDSGRVFFMDSQGATYEII